jgi:hypothetical protein
LNLLALLARNKLGDFHTELELIPLQHQEKLYGARWLVVSVVAASLLPFD